jgi:hypothetical protein
VEFDFLVEVTCLIWDLDPTRQFSEDQLRSFGFDPEPPEPDQMDYEIEMY